MKRFFALLVMVLVWPLSAQAWWDEAWTLHKKITLDTQASGVTVDTVMVPVLVRLSSGNFDFLSAKEDGSDIRFVAEDDKTLLPFHIERYDHVNELAFVWVLVPKLAANNATQSIWLYYGNENATPLTDTKASFDAATLAVYHLADAQSAWQDVSGRGNHASATDVTWSADGLIAGAAKLAGNGYVDVPVQATEGLTLSMWVKLDKADGALVTMGGLSVSLVNGVPTLAVGSSKAKAEAAMSLNTWHHVALVAGQAHGLFIDGKPVATVAAPFAPGASLRVGSGLSGMVDEVQLASEVRSPGWIAVAAQSQGPMGTLVKLGEDKSSGNAEGPSYFKTTMDNVTVDGWVVIAVLAVMFVISVWVMISKSLLISRMQKANDAFAQAFATTSRTLMTLEPQADKHAAALDALVATMQTYPHSSLARLFAVGVSELKLRFPQAKDAGLPRISPQSMSAVRATVDTQLTKEAGKLNKSMVLLTIAISGGPYLGLLGTVVGVMITFAAIAAAGDVNVNAIAPGIAAALVATVAGLAVAIPALFGYNYLTTRIKSLATDMHVFVDEFVTKMAENYGG
jgi:biopolymer transport protein ExbB